MTIEQERIGDVVRITLNRPDKMNALDEAAAAELVGVLAGIAEGDARAVVIAGAGRGFCAGRDLADATPSDEDAASILEETFNPVFIGLRNLPMPSIAQVHGPALGVGLGIALGCDLCVASETAKFGSPFARIGAVLDSGGHHHLVQRLGPHRALELIYTGDLIDGNRAVELGLINRSVPEDRLVEEVTELAAAIAAGPTAAFAISKRLVQQTEDGELTFARVLSEEAVAQGRASRTDDYTEGISAFQNKRRPTFTGK